MFTAVGPSDIVSAHRRTMSGERIQSETSVIFSGQIVEYFREQNIQSLVTSSYSISDEVVDANICLMNIPRRWDCAGGWRYHLGHVMYALRLAFMARRFRADIAIIDSGTAQYFALVVFRLLGVPVAVNFHNVRWPLGSPPTGIFERLHRKMDSLFFRFCAVGATGCSPECADQFHADGADQVPFFHWRAQFRADDFVRSNIPPRPPFRLLFVGRVERSKGVFDLLDIAEQLKAVCADVVINVCGDGSALNEFSAEVVRRNLKKSVTVLGRLARTNILQQYRQSHAVIVPTRADIGEGMPMVCAEAVLSRRPLVTSRVSSALPVIGDAIAEALPEDPTSYVEQVRHLLVDDLFYNRLRSACQTVSSQFLDRAQSYPAAVDRLIGNKFPHWKLLDDYERIFDRLH